MTAPGATFSLNTTVTTSLPQPPNNTGVWTVGADAVKFSGLVADCYGATGSNGGVSFQGRAADGTGASPGFLPNGAPIVGLEGRSWNGSGFGVRGSVNVVTTEDHSATAGGAEVQIKACRQGALALAVTAIFGCDSDGTPSVYLPDLPTADPHEANRLWNNAGVLSVSAG